MTDYKALADNLKSRTTASAYPPKRENSSTKRFPVETLQKASVVFITGAACVFALCYFLLTITVSAGLEVAVQYGLFMTSLFLSTPITLHLFHTNRSRRLQGFDQLFSIKWFQQHFLLFFSLYFLQNQIGQFLWPSTLLSSWEFYSQWFGVSALLTVAYEGCLLVLNGKGKSHPSASSKEASFSLWLGQSTGKLANLSHGAALAKGQEVVLSLKDACQNIICFGGIGSGKTSRLINPALLQLLNQDCGGLIFDVKSNFHETVTRFARGLGKEARITKLGIGGQPLNLIEGLTPEMAATFLKSSVVMGGTDSTFWADTATQLCTSGLGVLSFFPEKYTLSYLHRYLFNPEEKQAINEQLKEIANDLSQEQWQTLKNYLEYEEVFEKFDDRTKRNVLSTVSQVLEAFRHPQIVDAFCQTSPFNMANVVNGTIYLLSLPLAEWGFGGKVVYNFIKLRFYNVMNQRRLRLEWNQDRPVFFLCDEFQAVISGNSDGESDLNFWDKARDANTIGIVSAQAISSFYAAIQDKYIADTIMGNFRQKICFRSENQETLDYFNRLTGQVEVERHTYTKQTGSSERVGFLSSNASRSKSESKTLVQKPVVDSQLMRTMEPEQAIATLLIKNYSCDDILLTGEVI